MVMATNSVIKAFRIIEHLSIHREAGVSEISAGLNMDKTTVYRLLATMKEIGYISQNASSQRYRLSPKFANLTEPAPDHQNLIEMAHPYLEELTGLTDEAVSLAFLSGADVVYVDHIDSQHAIKVNAKVGGQYPAHTVGIGKAIMAYLPAKQVEGLYKDREMAVRTPNTISSLSALQSDLAKVKKRGYAVDNEECSPGLFCLAAPIFDASGFPVAGISTGFPLYRHTAVAEQKKLAKIVRQTAGRLSEALGYTGPKGKASKKDASPAKLNRKPLKTK